MPRTIVLAERESSFTATVQEGTPYRWTAMDFSIHLIGSLRLAQITYFPPTSLEELKQYDAATGTSSSSPVYSVRAIVRTLTANNKVEDFVLACFPLEVNRLEDAVLFTAPSVAKRTDSGIVDGPGFAVANSVAVDPLVTATSIKCGSSPSQPTVASLLPRRRDAYATMTNTFVLPCLTDIATGLNIHVGLDGFTELRVEGPGTVVFSGEEKIGVLSPSRRECGFL